MKILVTAMMMAAMTSAFAGDCKLNGDCASDADCKALNKDFSVISGKCLNPKANETETQCAGIVSTSGAKGSTSDSAAADGQSATGKSK